MFVTDTVFLQKLTQDHPIELRPTRTCDAADIAKEFDLVLAQQFEEIIKCVPAVADGVNL